MAQTFRCSIVTPIETVLDEDVSYATFAAWDGQLGVMTGQSPLLTRVGYGSLRLDYSGGGVGVGGGSLTGGGGGGGSRWFLIEGGFAQVIDGHLNLLTDRATPAEKLSLDEAEAELAEANARVIEPGQDRKAVERDQQRAMAKRSLARQFASDSPRGH